MTETRQIVIIGSGLAGAMTAAYLGRMLPRSAYNVLYLESLRETPYDVLYGSAHSDLQRFNRLLKINEAEFLRLCDGIPSLGERTLSYAQDYLNTYCPYGLSVEGVSFPAAMQKIGLTGDLRDWEHYNLPALMIRQSKFLPPDSQGRTIISDYSYGYQINPARYTDLLREKALSFGVVIKPETRQEIETVGGNVKSLLITENGTSDATRITPHLVINCGADADLIKTTPSWRDSPVKPLFFTTTTQYHSDMNNHIIHDVLKINIKTSFTLQSETQTLQISDKGAWSLQLGSNSTPWTGNVITFDKSWGLLPLFAAPLRIVQIALERLMSFFPSGETMQAEAFEYNSLMTRTFQRLDDFQLSWLKGTAFGEKLDISLSDEARHKAALFKARGRLSLLDDDTLLQDQWTSLFLGQDHWPHGYDLMSEQLDTQVIKIFQSNFKDIVNQALMRMPKTSDFIAQSCPTLYTPADTNHAS